MPNVHIAQSLKKTKRPYLSKHPVGIATRLVLDIKSRDVYNRTEKFILGKKILDVGVGIGGINAYLKNKGYEVKGIDVKDYSILTDTDVTLYNGKDIPFEDNTFETALIVHVLHHCEDRFKVLAEALRVSKRVIVIEDTYRDDFERKIVSVNDQIGNWEFYEHPYNTYDWWKKYLEEQRYNIIHMESFSTFSYYVQYGRYVLFVIEK